MILRPVNAMMSIGTPAPMPNERMTRLPARSVCWRITCTSTAARIGPAQGVHTSPINAPMSDAAEQAFPAGRGEPVAEIGQTLRQRAEFFRQSGRQQHQAQQR